MTYGLAFATDKFVGIVTDRRMTSTGPPQEDEDKCGFAVLPGAHVGYTMSGLAVLKRPGQKQAEFLARDWIPENLCRAARGRDLDGTLRELADRATAEMARLEKWTNPESRRLSIIFGGFSKNLEGIAYPVLRMVSNFQSLDNPRSNEARPTFEISSAPLTPGAIAMTWTGSGPPSARDRDKIAELLISRPPSAAINYMAKIVREEANRNSYVGKWCSTILIPHDPTRGTLADYHPGKPTRDLRFPAFTHALYDELGAYCTTGGRVIERYGGSEHAMKVPPSERNKPCSCKSGKPYKKCHGSTRPIRRPSSERTHLTIETMLITVEPASPEVEQELFGGVKDGIVFGSASAPAKILYNGNPKWSVTRS